MSATTSNSAYLRSLLNVKYLLSDTDDMLLTTCMDSLFDAFGSKRDILDVLVRHSSKQQLDEMAQIIQRR